MQSTLSINKIIFNSPLLYQNEGRNLGKYNQKSAVIYKICLFVIWVYQQFNRSKFKHKIIIKLERQRVNLKSES